MAKSRYHPTTVYDGEMVNILRVINENLLDIKKTLDTIGIVHGCTVEVTDTGAANAEFAVNHRLGVVPDGYMCTWQDKSGTVYNGSTAWSGENIYLKCSAANAHMKILVYIKTS